MLVVGVLGVLGLDTSESVIEGHRLLLLLLRGHP